MTIERYDLVRLRHEHTTVGVVTHVKGRVALVRWLFKQPAPQLPQADVEVVGRYSGAQ